MQKRAARLILDAERTTRTLTMFKVKKKKVKGMFIVEGALS